MMSAYTEGRNAYYTGSIFCPYDKDTTPYEYWWKGWFSIDENEEVK